MSTALAVGKEVKLKSLMSIFHRIKMYICHAYKFCFGQSWVKMPIVSKMYLYHSSTQSCPEIVFPTHDVQKYV
jgi:hypothetical protein